MPPFGFVGFPVFALSVWSLYQALHLVAGARLQRGAAFPKYVTRGVVVAAVAFSIVTLRAMDRRTVSSTVPALNELPGANESVLATLRELNVRTPFRLSKLDPTTLADDTGLPVGATSVLVETATLATHRGIGVTYLLALHQSGIRSVCDLARADMAAIWRAAHATPEATFRPTEPEVRVWIRAAQRRCSE